MSIVRIAIPMLTAAAVLSACSSGQSSNAATDTTTVAAAPAPAPAAAAPAPASPSVAVDIHWDSAPLDRDYRAERAALDARHAREIAHPAPGETAAQRDQRHQRENQALEARYAKGKETHAKKLPDKQ